jgi:hypothetical protein
MNQKEVWGRREEEEDEEEKGEEEEEREGKLFHTYKIIYLHTLDLPLLLEHLSAPTTTSL